MELSALIFIILLIIQFVLALYAILVQHKIDEKYNFPLSSMVEAATALENYVKIYRPVNLKVHARIKIPAFALKEFVLINKDRMYDFDLFTNFFTIFQLEMTKKENSVARNLYITQNFLFFFQIISFLIGIFLQHEVSSIILLIALGLQVLGLLVSIIGFLIYSTILNEVLDIAYDLLDFDEVETARAEALKADLQYNVFEYPIEFIRRTFLFFVPS